MKVLSPRARLTARATSTALLAVAAVVVMTANASAQRVAVPRTPWGDPDLQGTFTNKDEAGTIVQAPGYLAIRYESMHDVRIIPLDGRPHANLALPRTWVTDAADLKATRSSSKRRTSGTRVYRGANPDKLKVIERFTPKPGGKLEWSVTVADPSTWAGLWTFSMALTADSGERILEYACHEGNRSMANVLSGARAQERTSYVGK